MKFTRQAYMFATVLAMATALVSCSKEDLSPDDPASTVIRPQRLVQQTDCVSWTVEEFNETMQGMYRDNLSDVVGDVLTSEQMEVFLNAMTVAQFGGNVPILAAKFLLEGSKGFHFERQNFLYRSVTAAGDSATFSGSVMYPYSDSDQPHTLDGWTVYSDFATTNNEICLSKKHDGAYFRAVFNQAIAFCDTQGFGATNVREENATTPLLPCYGDNYAKARQLVDATIAASEVLDIKGIKMAEDKFVENIGVSLGCPVVLNVLKYIESEEACQGWVRDSLFGNVRTFAATGPMNIWDVFSDLLEKDEPLPSTSFYIPMMIVTSAFASFPDKFNDYAIADFFDPRMSDIMVPTTLGDTVCILDAISSAHYDDWACYGTDELELYFETKIHNMMDSCMFNEDGTPNLDEPKMALLKMAMESWSVNKGWNPTTPVLMAHSNADDVISVDEITEVYDQFRAANKDVCFIPVLGDHATSSLLCHMYMQMNPHPSLYVDKWSSIFDLEDNWSSILELTSNWSTLLELTDN